MSKRRMNGEGSWGQAKIGGHDYYYFRDSNRKMTYGKTVKEVKEKLKEKEQDKNAPVVFDKKLTVGEYVQDWLYNKKYREVGISIQPTTFDAYEDGLSVRFFKFKDYPLALRQLHALSLDMINSYLKALAKKYSRKSIQKTWEVLRMCFTDDDYFHYDLMPKLNFSKIKLPTESNVAVKKKNIKFTAAEDMDILYRESFNKNPHSGHTYGNAAKLLVFIMYSGLRLSEACGLKWKNVDLKNELISIKETYNTIKTRDESGKATGRTYIDKSPKTESSTTTIPYRKRAGEMLKAMNELYPNHKPDDYVFLTKNGTPFTKRAVDKTFQRMINNAGLQDKGYTVHSLRHGYGSVLYEEGVDIKTISQLLRHADIQTTANIYIHPTNDTLKSTLNKIDQSQNIT